MENPITYNSNLIASHVKLIIKMFSFNFLILCTLNSADAQNDVTHDFTNEPMIIEPPDPPDPIRDPFERMNNRPDPKVRQPVQTISSLPQKSNKEIMEEAIAAFFKKHIDVYVYQFERALESNPNLSSAVKSTSVQFLGKVVKVYDILNLAKDLQQKNYASTVCFSVGVLAPQPAGLIGSFICDQTTIYLKLKN